MNEGTFSAAGPVEGIFIETAHEFWGIPVPENIDDDPLYEDLLLLDPRDVYDHCVIGVAQRFNDRFVLYSTKCVIEQIVLDSDPSDDPDDDPWTDALEHFSFNIIGSYVGEHTPGFLDDLDR